MIALLHLHGIAQRPAGPWDDGDLLHWCAMGRKCCDKGMADLMIGNDAFLFVRQDRMLLLITGDDDLDGLLHVFLCRIGTMVADSA